jgi:hypothetical protein
MNQAANLLPVRRPNPFSPKSRPASRLIITGHRCWLTLLPLFLTAGLLPLPAQVTVEVLDQADATGASAEALSTMGDPATRGGNVVYPASSREGSHFRSTIRLNAVTTVRGARSHFSLPPGDSAPGTASTFEAFSQAVFVNASGRIAFTANTLDNDNFGFWAGAPSALQLVARHGSLAPGTNGTFSIGYTGNTFGSLMAFNDAGQVAFSARIEGVPPGTDSGRWAGAPGALQLVARTGSQAPGFPNGTTWTSLGNIQLNALGHVAITGSLSQAPPADTLVENSDVLMVGPPGALRLVARSGDPALEAEPFTFFSLSAKVPMLNSSDQVVYTGDIQSGKFGITPTTSVIYLGSNAGSRLVARSRYPAPGTDADAVFGEFDQPLLNAAGEVAFAADVRSAALTNSHGIWLGKPGRLRKIARTNDVAPGTGGQLFGSLKGMRMALSDSGQVAFLSTFSPGGGVFGNNATTGLFATDKTGKLQLVARVGTAIGSEVVLNDLQLPDDPARPGSGDSKRTGFDRDGRLVFLGSGTAINPERNPTYLYRASFAESAPVILPTGQPLSVRASTGGSAVLEVNALGSRPATYQWQRNGQNVPGATSATLTLNALTPAERGTYTVIVTNAYGNITSSAATLTFPPVLTTQPTDVQLNAGTTLTLPAAATGPGTISYQWQFKAAGAADFTNVSAAANATLTIPNIAAGQAGRYRVVATSSSDGSTTSQEAVVTVAAAGAPLVKRIFIPGDPVPGFSNNAALLATAGSINNAGDIAYQGLTDNNYGYSGTYFRSAAGSYRFVQWQANSPNLSDSTVMAQVNSRPSSTIELGLPENMLPLARRGEPAPNGAGNYDLDAGFALSDNGTAAYSFSAGVSRSAVFIGKPGATSLLARTYLQAPGLPEGVEFNIMSDPVISPSGTAAFFATLSGTGISDDNDTSLWKSTATGVQRIVAESDPVPSAGSGVKVGDIFFPLVRETPFGWNEAGQVAFTTTLAGNGITFANEGAILAGLPGALAIACRDGVSDGHTFDVPQRAYPLINRTGQVAFVANVTPAGTSNVLESVWRWTPGPGGGTRQLIAREGQQAPDLPAGVVMDSTTFGKPNFSFSMNGSGQLILSTRLAGPGISYDAGNDMAVYLSNAAGALKLIARTGGTIDIGGGVFREVGFLSLSFGSGGEDGRSRCLNEAGETVLNIGLGVAGSGAYDNGLFTARLAPDTTALTAAYNTWSTTAFPAGSGASVNRLDADPDKDGNPNAIEYLMASPPGTAGASLLTLQPIPQGLGFTFPRRVGVPDGFEIIESTASLEGPWTPVGRTSIKRTSNGAGQPDTVTVQLPAGEEKRFVRVRVAL